MPAMTGPALISSTVTGAMRFDGLSVLLALDDGPATAERVAALLGLRPEAARHRLDALTRAGLVGVDPAGRYAARAAGWRDVVALLDDLARQREGET